LRIPSDISNGLVRFIEAEIQAGRRYASLDSGVVSAFLALQAPDQARKVAETHPSHPARPVPPPAPPTTPAASMPVHIPEAETPRLASIDDVAAAVASCTKCVLCNSRTQTVPGVGNASHPEIMFIGEGPGQEEDARGEPFVGAAGQLLTKMIQAMGFKREEVFIANVVKCRPPGNRVPETVEIEACMPWLRNQIEIIKPKCIVALGATALKGLMGNPRVIISKDRGVWHKFGSIPMMPTFHPAYLLRYEPAKKSTWEDLKKVLEFLGKTPPPTQKKQA
jgi:DNA polymerase